LFVPPFKGASETRNIEACAQKRIHRVDHKYEPSFGATATSVPLRESQQLFHAVGGGDVQNELGILFCRSVNTMPIAESIDQGRVTWHRRRKSSHRTV
jgi:hypothetical protein